MDKPINVAITRTVRPGREHDFEKAILAFFAESLQDTTTQGALLLRPSPGSGIRTYGILRSFANEQDRDAFYRSDTFAQWDQAVKPYVEEDYSLRELHGLEAFFHDQTSTHSPTRWKMAILTWSAVWPTVLVVASLLGPYRSDWHFVLAVGLDTFFVVLILTWIVMPALTRLTRPWWLR
ncbi:antibiotic biosynthesis monooxygenase [Thermodesulfobacteriota bacterium]